jgi:hypothetical protein
MSTVAPLPVAPAPSKPRPLAAEPGYWAAVDLASKALTRWIGAGVAGVSHHAGGPTGERTPAIAEAERDYVFATTYPSKGRVPAIAETLAQLAEQDGRADVAAPLRALAAYVAAAQAQSKAVA